MLFKESTDWESNADVTSGGEYYNMWDKYASSYKLAAETIAKEVSNDHSKIDYLICPLVFLYRHYFELRIKEILYSSGEEGSEKLQKLTHHDLIEIWKESKMAIIKIRPDVSHDNLSSVEEILKSFNRYDHRSMEFRYPVDKRSNPTLASLNAIDVKHFITSLETGIKFLEDITRLISATIDFREEIEASK